MPTFDIVKTSNPTKSFRVASVMGSFDLQDSQITERFVGNIDLDFSWNIGVIVGASGTGKSSIANHLFSDYIVDKYQYNAESVLDDMPSDCDIKTITQTFCQCGFASTTSWLKPYSVLSNGEKMRVDIARSLLLNNEITVFDEFTSVVDRNVAKIGSHAIQKNVRRNDKKFIAVTCHYDVVDWLCPDWIFDTNNMQFTKCCKKKDQTLSLLFKKEANRTGDILAAITI